MVTGHFHAVAEVGNAVEESARVEFLQMNRTTVRLKICTGMDGVELELHLSLEGKWRAQIL